jgi:hypothetical protein
LEYLDFIDADSVDLAERPVLQPEVDDVFHRAEDLVPRSAEGPPFFHDSRRAQRGK